MAEGRGNDGSCGGCRTLRNVFGKHRMNQLQKCSKNDTDAAAVRRPFDWLNNSTPVAKVETCELMQHQKCLPASSVRNNYLYDKRATTVSHSKDVGEKNGNRVGLLII